MKLVGHLERHDDLIAHKFVLWESTQGHRSRGRPTLTYIDVLRRDTGLNNLREIKGLMNWQIAAKKNHRYSDSGSAIDIQIGVVPAPTRLRRPGVKYKYDYLYYQTGEPYSERCTDMGAIDLTLRSMEVPLSSPARPFVPVGLKNDLQGEEYL